jgi:hypothetical protein
MTLVLSKGHKEVGIFNPSPEDGKRRSLPNAMFCSYLEFWALGKVEEYSDSL